MIKNWKSFNESSDNSNLLNPKGNGDKFLNSLGIKVSVSDPYPSVSYRKDVNGNFCMYGFNNQQDQKILINYLEENDLKYEIKNSEGARYPFQVIIKK